jgi:ectoine hydroxylase-related dioxygenase (phytanoyl-CoA dioxygenase family)
MSIPPVSPATSSELTPTFDVDVEQYRRDGYLLAPAVVTPEHLARLRAESDRLIALCMADPQGNAHRLTWEADYLAEENKAGMDKVIRKIEPLIDISPVFTELAAHPGVTEPIEAIFGEPLELFEDKLNLKLPGGSSYPWHQDWNCCWRAHTDELITCFIYLDDADMANGCLQVVPGSHANKQIYPFKPGTRFTVDPACIDPEKVVPAPLRAGEMIFFDPYLLHYSDLNHSHTPRRAIIYTYNPARLGKINEKRFRHK